MSEMTDDPVLDKLKLFTPDGSSLDSAEILFSAGRASVRTPRGWKIAVAGLLLAILGLIDERMIRQPQTAVSPASGSPDDRPAIIVQPAYPIPTETSSPWRFCALQHLSDPNDLPGSAALSAISPGDPPLTPRSRGEFD